MEIKVFCNHCGLKSTVVPKISANGDIWIKSDPCQACISEAKNVGFGEGKEQGYSEGLIAGQTS